MQADKGKINKGNSKVSSQTHIIEEIGVNGEIQYNCTACRKVFRSRSQRYYHITCNELQNLNFKCEYCEKAFARKTQWKYHTESHISPMNECHKCKKTFSNPLALKKHLTLHTVEPKLCPHCDKTFKKKSSLDQHVASQHLNYLQYGCAHCSKKYSSKSSLQLHLQKHENNRFECKFCGKRFQRNSILNLHMKRHYNKNAYVCSVCQKVFNEAGDLARHRKIHEESALQYYCILCEKNILRKDNMTRHVVTIHPEEKYDEIVKKMKSPITIPTAFTTSEDDICNLKSKKSHILKTEKSFVIIENKLLNEPFEKNKNQKNISKGYLSKDNNAEYTFINQIKVITTLPICNNEIIAHVNENAPQLDHVIENQKISYEDVIETSLSGDVINVEDKDIEQNIIITENIAYVDHVQSDISTNCNQFKQNSQNEVKNMQKDIHTEQNEKNNLTTAPENQQESLGNEPQITKVFSSVIKSVGNVNKKLTSDIIQPSNQTNQMSLEYKHKKYCRNNYNIDLYRKILGCDENDDNVNIQNQEKYDHILKSSTPVHWRKSFKNNYETTGT